MKWSILYERNADRVQINTTFISKLQETDLVVRRFEQMHRNRLTVIKCKPQEPKRKTIGKKILLVQFTSEMLTKQENPQAKQYYDKLYQTRFGYNRFGPVWEIPVWIAEMKRNFPDSRVLFANSVDEVLSISSAFDTLAFSALDCNWPFIHAIAENFSGRVFVGGYCGQDKFADLPNVIWCESVKNLCENLKIPFRSGVDYTVFSGAKTIARLTLSIGCSHNCRFCIQPKIETIPYADVWQQIDEICKLDSPLVYLNDKTFGQAKNFWLLPLLAQYLGRNMKTGFDGFIIQTTASQLLKIDDDLLIASGVRYVELGVETYNNEILRDMKKPANEKIIDAAANKLRQINVKLIPNILIGLPNETAATYTKTLNWLNSNADIISHLNIYNLVIYADTELANEIEPNATDYDENQTTKSWHINADLHRAYAAKLYDFGNKCLDEETCKCALCLTSRTEQDTTEICGRCKAETR
jgi:hypothetical protein